jgi:uncharacterized protein (TIGR03032 family)
MAVDSALDEQKDSPSFQITVSRGLSGWLTSQKVSLAFTIPAQKLFLLGIKADGQLSVFERTLQRCMGIAAVGSRTLYLSTRYQIWRMECSMREGQLAEGGYDRQYIPRVAYTTGLLNTHDVTVDARGRLLFVATRFGCLASVSEQYSFVPLWRPPFLSSLAPGDRCHMNGIALVDGLPAYATSVSQDDVLEGWREHRRSGGTVTDVRTNQIVLTGLSMPHSPRWYRDRLWLTNSGSGQFGWVDLERGVFEPVVFAPGFLRGLSFVGDYAIVGSSKPRYGNVYSGLALDEELERRKQSAHLGFFIVNLKTGQVEHWFFIESEDLRELYDVVALPGVRQPMALGFMTDEIQRSIWFDPPSFAAPDPGSAGYVHLE